MIKYISDYKSIKNRKKDTLYLDIDKVVDWIVEYTILLKEETDIENVKICIKLLLDRFKEDYNEIIIYF